MKKHLNLLTVFIYRFLTEKNSQTGLQWTHSIHNPPHTKMEQGPSTAITYFDATVEPLEVALPVTCSMGLPVS